MIKEDDKCLSPFQLKPIRVTFVTFDQNGKNAISADFEFLAASLPS